MPAENFTNGRERPWLAYLTLYLILIKIQKFAGKKSAHFDLHCRGL